MSDKTFSDLNDAFGKALLDKFFEPILESRGPNGEAYYAPSGVGQLARELYHQHAREIMDEVWERIDMDVLAQKIADQIVKDLTRVPGRFDPKNLLQEDLANRVKDFVAQQLGQRVVDAMDLRLGEKELGPGGQPI